MKTPLRLPFALLTVCAALPVGGLLAQAPAAPAAATPSVSAPAQSTDGEEGEGKVRERAMALSPEERQKLRAAHRAALEDPAVKAAEATRASDKKGYRKTLRDAMIKADPSILPILEKMREERPRKKNIDA